MPVPVLKKFAEESGKTLAEAEKAWEEAKIEAKKQYDEDHPAYWPTVTNITKNKLGIKDKEDESKKAKPKKKPR